MMYTVHHYTVPSVKAAEKSDGDHVNNRGVSRAITVIVYIYICSLIIVMCNVYLKGTMHCL